MSTATTPFEVQRDLLDALHGDLIGPSGSLGDHRKTLPHAPSRWYLTGFLVPTDADEDQRLDPKRNDEVAQAPTGATVGENHTSEQATGKRYYQSITAQERFR